MYAKRVAYVCVHTSATVFAANLDFFQLCARVTRLGEFSPLGQIFSLGSFFLKIPQIAKIIGLLFSTVKDI
jgi:hypothetical protein